MKIKIQAAQNELLPEWMRVLRKAYEEHLNKKIKENQNDKPDRSKHNK
jgi:hypothetical protein